MAYFRFPQAWVAAALAAAASAFGSFDDRNIQIRYRELPPGYVGAVYYSDPDWIVIDKRPRAAWTRSMALCTVAHEYGHIAGRRHSSNPRSIMYYAYRKSACTRWLRQHGVFTSWLIAPVVPRNLLLPSVDMQKSITRRAQPDHVRRLGRAGEKLLRERRSDGHQPRPA